MCLFLLSLPFLKNKVGISFCWGAGVKKFNDCSPHEMRELPVCVTFCALSPAKVQSQNSCFCQTVNKVAKRLKPSNNVRNYRSEKVIWVYFPKNNKIKSHMGITENILSFLIQFKWWSANKRLPKSPLYCVQVDSMYLSNNAIEYIFFPRLLPLLVTYISYSLEEGKYKWKVFKSQLWLICLFSIFKNK